MPRKTTPTLTDGELKVMEVLWQRGEASVRDVTDQLSKKQPVAYSTALTMLRILHKKGYVTYRKEGRAFIYKTLVNRREARKDALRHLMHRFFGNSPTALAQNLIDEGEIDMAELARLQERVDSESEEDR